MGSEIRLKCPLCLPQSKPFTALTTFWEHCLRKHTEIIDQELTARTITMLTESHQRARARDAEIQQHVRGESHE